jgi:ribulose-5-phosphate 4-epimerase/fuculose-1-phosphate aldolase
MIKTPFCVILAAACSIAGSPAAAQQPATPPAVTTTPVAAAVAAPATGGPVDAAAIDDLVAAGRILVDQGVLDGFGHVSMRHPKDPNRFLMSRSLAPALVTADDVMEFDLDSNPVDAKGRTTFLERFIHGEIYKARPDVMAIAHSHAPSVIPFTVSQVPMKAMFHNSAFLAAGVPVFEIRKSAGMTNMLVGNGELGKALAASLADKPVVLMRGHGYVATGPTVPIAVFRAVYTEVNARLQQSAIALGGPYTTLELEEGVKADKVNEVISARPWDLWRRKALGK